MIGRDSHTSGWTAQSLLLFMVLTVGSATTANCASVAMVTDLQGRATYSKDDKSRDVTILAEIAAGAKLQLDAGGVMAALYLETGDEYIFKGPAQIVFAPARPLVIVGAKPEKRGPPLG